MENTQPAEERVRASTVTLRQWLFVLIAVVLAIAVVPIARQLRSRDVPDTWVLLTSIVSADGRVDTLLLAPIWSETNGQGQGALAAESRAVRLGAAIAELELRHLRADSAARSRAQDVVRLLESFPRSEAAIAAYRAFGDRAEDSALRSAAAQAERVAGRGPVRLGAWLQSARFAAATADSTVFDRPSITSVSRAAISYDPRPETEFAVRQFEEIVRERPHNWTALATAVDELLRLLGTR